MLDRWYKAPVACVFEVRISKMPASLFRAWHQFMALASLNGGDLPDIRQMAFALHSAAETIVKRLNALAERGLAVLTDDVWRLVDVTAKGKGADDEAPLTGAERTRRWRARSGSSENASGDAAVTARDAQKREDETRLPRRVSARPGAAPPRPGAWIARDAEGWAPWAAWWRREHGKDPPTDRRGGWLFPALEPPPFSPVSVAAE